MFVYNWHNYVGLPFIIHTNGIINKRMVRFNFLLLQPTGDLMYFGPSGILGSDGKQNTETGARWRENCCTFHKLVTH